MSPLALMTEQDHSGPALSLGPMVRVSEFRATKFQGTDRHAGSSQVRNPLVFCLLWVCGVRTFARAKRAFQGRRLLQANAQAAGIAYSIQWPSFPALTNIKPSLSRAVVS